MLKKILQAKKTTQRQNLMFHVREKVPRQQTFPKTPIQKCSKTAHQPRQPSPSPKVFCLYQVDQKEWRPSKNATPVKNMYEGK